MQVLKFTLKGKTAFFKKPDVNTYLYFTYGQIHKVALLGLFGAILGYNGYGQMKAGDLYPEFYEKLKEIKLSIVPGNPEGLIPKKVQSFNNSVGYASQEQGGNLIVKEQWLEGPKWDIYILLDSEVSKRLADSIINHRSVYSLYLGKNDHPADLINPSIIPDAELADKVSFVHSLIPKDWVDLDLEDEEEQAEGLPFKYEEYLPVALDQQTNLYQLQNFVYSNLYLYEKRCEIIKVNEKYLAFY